MEIVVTGRHTEINERFRNYVEDKFVKVSPLTPNAQRVDVVVTHERNPRLAGSCERVELTVRGKGPVIRAEASSDDRFAALDLAMAKLLERLRRVRDRKKDRRGSGESAAVVGANVPLPTMPTSEADSENVGDQPFGDSPIVIREKVHDAHPMSIDDALYEMELVGHDFFLFVDVSSGRPSAVYRRRGWSYGVISLNVVAPPE